MSKSVFCIATTESQAHDIVGRLKAANIDANDISVLFPDKSGTRDFAHEQNTKMPEGAAIGAGAGGILGGGLGWLAGIGTLAIPGFGPFIAAGPILAALGGAALGATFAGIAGALVGMGIPEFEAKRYEGKIQKGNILLSVHCRDGNDGDVKKIFEAAGAEDISTSSEASVPSKMKADTKDYIDPASRTPYHADKVTDIRI